MKSSSALGQSPLTRAAGSGETDKQTNSKTQKPTFTLDDLPALEAIIAEYERQLKWGAQ
jgi:hypothetical protein